MQGEEQQPYYFRFDPVLVEGAGRRWLEAIGRPDGQTF
jgi:hypothetical protein